jgi:hypothetical protein
VPQLCLFGEYQLFSVTFVIILSLLLPALLVKEILSPTFKFQMFVFTVAILFVFNYTTNIQPILISANIYQGIFDLFSKVLKIKEKKTAASTQLAKSILYLQV